MTTCPNALVFAGSTGQMPQPVLLERIKSRASCTLELTGVTVQSVGKCRCAWMQPQNHPYSKCSRTTDRLKMRVCIPMSNCVRVCIPTGRRLHLYIFSSIFTLMFNSPPLLRRVSLSRCPPRQKKGLKASNTVCSQPSFICFLFNTLASLKQESEMERRVDPNLDFNQGPSLVKTQQWFPFSGPRIMLSVLKCCYSQSVQHYNSKSELTPRLSIKGQAYFSSTLLLSDQCLHISQPRGPSLQLSPQLFHVASFSSGYKYQDECPCYHAQKWRYLKEKTWESAQKVSSGYHGQSKRNRLHQFHFSDQILYS